MICFSPYKYKLNATCRQTHKFLDNLRLFLPALFLELCLCFLADIFIRQRIRYGQSSLQLFLVFTEIVNKISTKCPCNEEHQILHSGIPNSIRHYTENQQCLRSFFYNLNICSFRELRHHLNSWWPLPVNLHSHQIMKYSFYSLSKQITRENFIPKNQWKNQP